MADIHCHIIPYVDDGAMNDEEAEGMLRMQAEQGVKVICCTPHLRKDMFETKDEKIREHFYSLKKLAEDAGIDIILALSREYHADGRLREKLENDEVIPMGEGNVILTEFSRAHSINDMERYIRLIESKGYRPLIAHAERYPALAGDIRKIKALKEMGAMIQVNAGSVLGREGREQAAWVKKILKNHLADVIASDAHGTQFRIPELKECRRKTERSLGREYADDLFYTTPLKILMKPRRRSI